MQANKKLLEMGCLGDLVWRVAGVLVLGGEEGVVGPGLGSTELACNVLTSG